MELIRVLSACVNLKRLTILNKDGGLAGEFPDAVLQSALPRLQHIHLEFKSKDSAVKLIRKLILPQCFQRILFTKHHPQVGPYVVDYRRFISPEESCASQSPESASIRVYGSQLEYNSYSHEIRFRVLGLDEDPAFHDLVQEIQSLSNQPSLTVTINAYSPQIWRLLKSLGDQNIQTVIGYFTATRSTDARDLLKAIGARPTDLTDLDGPMAVWPFASLRSIYIHDTCVELVYLTGLAKEYLHKDLKPMLEEIVFVHCSFRGMELAQAAESLAAIGITLQGVECFGSYYIKSDDSRGRAGGGASAI
ncbi:hypothetical protein FRC00_002646 [Tulasnella sp. 408]|nr:hypothetical protein FRC00_002646 [Tulasnella sp. 408]